MCLCSVEQVFGMHPREKKVKVALFSFQHLRVVYTICGQSEQTLRHVESFAIDSAHHRFRTVGEHVLSLIARHGCLS